MEKHLSDDEVNKALSCAQNIIDDAVMAAFKSGHGEGGEVPLLATALEVALLRAAAGIAVVLGRCSLDEDNLDAFLKFARDAYIEASGTKIKRLSGSS